MLKDRQILIETELTKLHDEAAHMYLNLVLQDDAPHSDEYMKLRERISELQHDYKMVKLLIEQGHA